MLNALLALDDGPQHETTVAAPPSPEECLARASLYRLLAGVFTEEPTREFLDALREPEAYAALAEAGLSFDADFAYVDVDELTDRLACEYATLFASSGGFPPVESVRLYGRYQQQPTFDTRETYRRLGFIVGRGRFEVFPDQLGVELMFVAELLERQAEAKDEAAARRLDKEIKRFWVQHLGRWVRGYAGLVARAAEHSFYREMARFLAGFAEEEIAALGLKVEDADQGRAVVPKSDIQVEFNPDEPVCDGCTPGRPDGKATVHPLQDLR